MVLELNDVKLIKFEVVNDSGSLQVSKYARLSILIAWSLPAFPECQSGVFRIQPLPSESLLESTYSEKISHLLSAAF